MFLPALHLPLISAGYFGAVIGRMLDFVSLRRSDQGMTPSLSPGLRVQTVALHRRLLMLASEFHRLARLAREGRLRVYPDRASPAARTEAARTEAASTRPRAAQCLLPPSPFGPAAGMAQGPALPALPTRGFGWMLGFVPAAHRDALAGLLANSEMVALIRASTSVACLLRPLCRGLSVTPPEGVFPASCRRQSRDTPRSQCRARTHEARSDEARTDLGGGTEAARASGPHEPGTLMSPKARDRWWAEHRGAARSAGGAAGSGEAMGVGDAIGAVRFGAPARGRCAKS